MRERFNQRRTAKASRWLHGDSFEGFEKFREGSDGGDLRRIPERETPLGVELVSGVDPRVPRRSRSGNCLSPLGWRALQVFQASANVVATPGILNRPDGDARAVVAGQFCER